jgi:hypothetical protein
MIRLTLRSSCKGSFSFTILYKEVRIRGVFTVVSVAISLAISLAISSLGTGLVLILPVLAISAICA